MKSVDDVISGSPLEHYFTGDIRTRIRIRSYLPGAKIRQSEGILFLLKGTVNYSYGDPDGIPYHIIQTSAFDSIGELVYYHNLKIYDILALEESIVAEVPLSVIGDLEEDSDFRILMLEKANGNMMKLLGKMHMRNSCKLENYLAYIILHDQFHGRFHYKSMTSLAAVFNVSRRNLYYAADTLIEQGMIEKGKGFFKIIDERKLRQMF